ncbi:MAG TPA: hypothetical protein VGV89_07580 [Thermoplasmata archaeon]|nr:hypothetical protein [Thermoplasmata archaeon]
MRPLTPSEAAVVRVLLGRSSDGDRGLIARSGVPRTTLQRIRRRAQVDGWLLPSEVPALAPLGVNALRVSLVHPFAEFHSSAVAEWVRRPEVAALWDLGEAFLAVTLRHEMSPPATGRGSAAATSWARSHRSVTVTAEQGALAAFFDFEGFWSQRVAMGPLPSYPRGLSFAPPTGSGRVRSGAAAALVRYLERRIGSRASGTSVLPWQVIRDRRWRNWFVDAGWLEPRWQLLPPKMPEIASVPSPTVVVVTGQIRSAGRPLETLTKLRGEAEVSPFFYVEDHSRVLLGAMGSAGSTPARRTGVLPTLRSTLANIEIFRTTIDRVVPAVTGRFVPPGGGPVSAP